jgi:hypothetical protein
MVGEGFFPGRESGLGTEIAGLLDLRRACPFPDCSWGAKLIDIPARLEIFAKAMERVPQNLRLPRSSASWWNSISLERISILRKAETL